MSELKVPEGMTWDTAGVVDMTVNVTDADGLTLDGVLVTVSTFSDTSPHDGSPLRRAVALDLIDSGVTSSGGDVKMSIRLPAHLTRALLVGSKGPLSGQLVVGLSDLKHPVALRMER